MKIALVSTGPLSGKSTLAQHLKEQYGFAIACHICTLVDSFVEKESNTNYPYHEFTVTDVYDNKEFYRQALQDHALAVGFHDPLMTGYWIGRTIAQTYAQPEQSMVFDPIRGAIQAQYLHEHGWTIVQLQISENERARRAAAMGKDYNQIWEAMVRKPDIEGGVDFADIALDAEAPTACIAHAVIAIVKEMQHDGNDTEADSANPAQPRQDC
jgi:hypothetical protein